MNQDEKAYIEKREHERVVSRLDVTFHAVEESEALKILRSADFQDVLENELHHQPDADVESLKAVAENLSVTGLGMVGDIELAGEKPATEGDYLLVTLKIPDRTPVRSLARVVWTSDHSDKDGQFRAGLFFEGISKPDVARVADQVRLAKGEL